MKKTSLHFFFSNRGSITIEFSIVLILFLFILLSGAEVARLFYISSSLDLAVSEAAKSAKNKESTNNSSYISILNKKLAAHQGVLGSFIAKNNEVNINVFFSGNVSDLVNSENSNDTKLPLVKYRISYLYRPVFFPISPSWANTLLLREVVFAQES